MLAPRHIGKKDYYMKRTLNTSTKRLTNACDNFTVAVDGLVGYPRFVSGRYYKSYNGKVVVHIPRRTPKSVYVNTHHTNPNEAMLYLKRIQDDGYGEYVFTDCGIPVFAEFEASAEEFREFINRNIGKERL